MSRENMLWCHLQHLVGARLNAWWHVAGVEGQLLHFCKVVYWVPVEYHFAHRDQRVFFMGPNLNEKIPLAEKFCSIYEVHKAFLNVASFHTCIIFNNLASNKTNPLKKATETSDLRLPAFINWTVKIIT